MNNTTVIKQSKFNEFNFGKLKLEMFWSGRTDARGGCQFEYRFTNDGILLQEGDDFALGCGQYPDSINAITSLLGFLTLKVGDTDDEYFKNYSPAMLAFTESMECEDLRTYLYDYEDNNDETGASDEAAKFFEEHCLINVA